MPVRASSKIQSAGLLLFRQRDKDVQLRAAFGEMSILDQHCRTPSFGGPPPEIVPLRHPTFAPNVSGSFTDDVHAARARISAEPV
jgi:hypothetical protein